jgi:type VI secretion system protein VasJ
LALTGRAEIVLSLHAAQAAEPVATATLWNFLLRKCGAATPSIVFLGGRLGTAYLALFRRALAPGDFVRLWTASPGNEGGGP